MNDNKTVQGNSESRRKNNASLTAHFVKRDRDKVERPICKFCKKPFWIDVNGDRAIFERDQGIVAVKYEQMLCICNSCFDRRHKMVVDENEFVEVPYVPEWIVYDSYGEKLYFAHKGVDLSDYGMEFDGNPKDDLSGDYVSATSDPWYSKMRNRGPKIKFLLKRLLGLR